MLLLGIVLHISLFAQPEPDSTSASAPPPSSSSGVLDTRLSTIKYGSGTISLDKNAKDELEFVIEMMKLNPSLVIAVQGHSDDQGTLEEQEYLSRNRAWLVWAYLVANGVPHYRVSYYGFGFRKPMVGDVTELAREENRRVEIHVVLPRTKAKPKKKEEETEKKEEE